MFTSTRHSLDPLWESPDHDGPNTAALGAPAKNVGPFSGTVEKTVERLDRHEGALEQGAPGAGSAGRVQWRTSEGIAVQVSVEISGNGAVR